MTQVRKLKIRKCVEAISLQIEKQLKEAIAARILIGYCSKGPNATIPE